MDEQPATRYVEAPDKVSLACHVGEDRSDLVWVAALPYPIDLLWDEPGFAHIAKRLRGFCQPMWYEGRGIGASGGSMLDNYTEGTFDADLTALLDAFGSEQVVLVASSQSGSLAVSYAAEHPERLRALVLIDTYAHYVREGRYPVGLRLDTLELLLSWLREQWGTGNSVEMLAPSKWEDVIFRERLARCERLGRSPDQTAESTRLAYLRDVRPTLPRITVPTLVLHREGDRLIRVEAGQYLGEHIPRAKYIELPGDDHLFFVGDTDALLDEIEEFLTGARQAPEGDVVMASILFTDIVSSTEQSARMGHRKWTTLVDDHDAMVRSTLTRYRGREVRPHPNHEQILTELAREQAATSLQMWGLVVPRKLIMVLSQYINLSDEESVLSK